MNVILYNPSSGPVVIDGDGHSIGGREWQVGDDTDPVTADLLGRDRLLRVEIAENAPESIRALKQRADDLNAESGQENTVSEPTSPVGTPEVPAAPEPDVPPTVPDEGVPPTVPDEGVPSTVPDEGADEPAPIPDGS